jgi:hypothetical protein
MLTHFFLFFFKSSNIYAFAFSLKYSTYSKIMLKYSMVVPISLMEGI